MPPRTPPYIPVENAFSYFCGPLSHLLKPSRRSALDTAAPTESVKLLLSAERAAHQMMPSANSRALERLYCTPSFLRHDFLPVQNARTLPPTTPPRCPGLLQISERRLAGLCCLTPMPPMVHVFLLYRPPGAVPLPHYPAGQSKGCRWSWSPSRISFSPTRRAISFAKSSGGAPSIGFCSDVP